MPTRCEHGIGFEGVARLVSQGGRIALGRDVLVRHVKVQVVSQSHPVVGGLALEVPGAVDTHPVEEREDHLLWDQSGSQGCIFRLACSYPELTEDHVLTSAYVKFFRTVTRNAVNKSV